MPAGLPSRVEVGRVIVASPECVVPTARGGSKRVPGRVEEAPFRRRAIGNSRLDRCRGDAVDEDANNLDGTVARRRRQGLDDGAGAGEPEDPFTRSAAATVTTGGEVEAVRDEIASRADHEPRLHDADEDHCLRCGRLETVEFLDVGAFVFDASYVEREN